MTLDTHTILAMLLVAAVLMTVTLSLGLRGEGAAKGLRKWNLGLGLVASAWLLIGLRALLPAILGYALADSLMLGGLCMQVAALLEFDGRRVPRALLWVPGPALFAAIVASGGNFVAFTLLVSAAFAAALAGIAFFALRAGRGGGPVRWMMAPFYLLGAGMLLARAADVWLHPTANPDVFVLGLLQSATFLALFAMTLAGSFSFLVMQRDRAEDALRRLAMVDELTGLFNRCAFFTLAERELARALRAGTPCAVLMLDLDYFKSVNDENGHPAGDRALAAFGALLRRSLRPQDVAGRLGGEEFGVLLSQAGAAEAALVAERLRAATAAAPLDGAPRIITLSAGFAVCPAGAPLDRALARADEALYRAKEQGRNRVAAAPEEAAAQDARRIAA
jgi:diguanylate cyclase (GGDEF)-like protein